MQTEYKKNRADGMTARDAIRAALRQVLQGLRSEHRQAMAVIAGGAA